jgi:hypothetical protein
MILETCKIKKIIIYYESRLFHLNLLLEIVDTEIKNLIEAVYKMKVWN